MPAARFMRKGITRFYFAPTIASATLVPTAAEVNAGTRLDTQLSDINGFSFSNSPINTPDMSTTFVGSMNGEDTIDSSSLTFYELKGATDTIHDAQPKNSSGYMVIFYAGLAGATPAAGDKADVWPLTVASNARQYTAGNEGAMYTVTYSMTAAPGETKTLT